MQGPNLPGANLPGANLPGANLPRKVKGLRRGAQFTADIIDCQRHQVGTKRSTRGHHHNHRLPLTGIGLDGLDGWMDGPLL